MAESLLVELVQAALHRIIQRLMEMEVLTVEIKVLTLIQKISNHQTKTVTQVQNDTEKPNDQQPSDNTGDNGNSNSGGGSTEPTKPDTVPGSGTSFNPPADDTPSDDVTTDSSNEG